MVSHAVPVRVSFSTLETLDHRIRSPAAHHVDGVAGARHATVHVIVVQARRRGRTSREIVILGRGNRVLSRIDAARDDDSIDESRRSTRERARAEARPRRVSDGFVAYV